MDFDNTIKSAPKRQNPNNAVTKIILACYCRDIAPAVRRLRSEQNIPADYRILCLDDIRYPLLAGKKSLKKFKLDHMSLMPESVKEFLPSFPDFLFVIFYMLFN